jgi:hypothetical protein
MSRLQREVVAELLRGRADVEIIETRGPLTPQEHATISRANVVILGCDDPAAACALLETQPRLAVLTLADREMVAWRYGLTPYRRRLGELSPAALTSCIEPREATCPWWNS